MPRKETTTLAPSSTAASEARGLLVLLGRRDVAENPETIRELIRVSAGEEQFLRQELKGTACVFIDYRAAVLREFDRLIKEKQQP
jgi:hypothetical protein